MGSIVVPFSHYEVPLQSSKEIASFCAVGVEPGLMFSNEGVQRKLPRDFSLPVVGQGFPYLNLTTRSLRERRQLQSCQRGMLYCVVASCEYIPILIAFPIICYRHKLQSLFRLPFWSIHSLRFPAEPVHGRRQSAGCEDQIVI